MRIQAVSLERGATFGFGQRRKLRLRRHNPRALHDLRHTLCVQKRHQRLAHGQFAHCFGNVQIGIAAECVGGGFHGFLVARGEGAQGVLHAVAQLPQHRVGQVGRVLCDEIHAHAFGAYQPHRLFDLFD